MKEKSIIIDPPHLHQQEMKMKASEITYFKILKNEFVKCISSLVSWGSPVTIVFDYRLDDRSLAPGRVKGFFLWPLCPEHL
jgi:hypothetical protein